MFRAKFRGGSIHSQGVASWAGWLARPAGQLAGWLASQQVGWPAGGLAGKPDFGPPALTFLRIAFFTPFQNAGKVRTEPGTGSRVMEEPEPEEPVTRTEPVEP